MSASQKREAIADRMRLSGDFYPKECVDFEVPP
jgi:hypothetical protein